MTHPLYSRAVPTVWGGPPQVWSYTTLSKLHDCALAYQLGVSSFDDAGHRLPERPTEAPVTGKLVHDALDALFTALVAAGLPDRGTAAFRQAVRAVNVTARLEAGLAERAAWLDRHPRGHGVQLKASALELHARVSSLFQLQYARVKAHRRPTTASPAVPTPPAAGPPPSNDDLLSLLRHHGSLSELEVTHPTLPIRGILDAVYLTDAGTVIADFKTGNPYDKHAHQLALYTLLWTRCTGDLPVKAELVYYSHTKTCTFTLDKLHELESDLKLDVRAYTTLLDQPPAPARPGAHCARCGVRAWCETRWDDLARLPDAQRREVRDLELVDVRLRDPEVLVGRDRRGVEVSVIFGADAPRRPEELVGASRVRILGGRWGEEGESFAVGAWSEVFGW